MSYVTGLRCSRCGTRYDASTGPTLCLRHDLGRLDITYDIARVGRSLTRGSLRKRGTDIWRYHELLPVPSTYAVRLHEGGTPLIAAHRLGAHLGLKHLYLKDETRNPTASFKDRAMAVGVAKARQLGAHTVVTASSGNAAAALAAYAAKANLTCYAFVLEGASVGKLAQLGLYGAHILKVRAVRPGQDPTVSLLLDAVRARGWYPCPSFGPFNPYQVEGPKTISYELGEKFGEAGPDWVLIPTGSTCLLAGIFRGFRDFHRLGLLDSIPHLAPVQPAGNAAFTRAVQAKRRFGEIEPEPHPSTVAAGLSDPFPWDGDVGLEAVRVSQGAAVAVPDPAILEAARDLARFEGVFAEPSGAAGVAGLRSLLEQGHLDSKDRVVVLVTGSGLKDLRSVAVRDMRTIAPEADALGRLLRL